MYYGIISIQNGKDVRKSDFCTVRYYSSSELFSGACILHSSFMHKFTRNDVTMYKHITVRCETKCGQPFVKSKGFEF